MGEWFLVRGGSGQPGPRHMGDGLAPAEGSRTKHVLNQSSRLQGQAYPGKALPSFRRQDRRSDSRDLFPLSEEKRPESQDIWLGCHAGALRRKTQCLCHQSSRERGSHRHGLHSDKARVPRAAGGPLKCNLC